MQWACMTRWVWLWRQVYMDPSLSDGKKWGPHPTCTECSTPQQTASCLLRLTAL